MITRKRIALWSIVICIVLLCGCSKGPVKTVESEISEIGVVKESSIDKIETARADYERLTEDEKAKVKNYQTLLDAEYDYDKIYAQKIDDLISDIGSVDDSLPSKIAHIKSQYEQLTIEQQRLVNKMDKLDELLEKYKTYQVEKIVELVADIQNKHGLFEENDFNEIDSRYASLDEEQKNMLEEKLGQTYEEAMQAVQVSRCEFYINQIDYIEGTPSKQELERILIVAEIYNSMSDSSKQSVKNIKAYNNAIKEIAKYKKNRLKIDKLYNRRQYISQCSELDISEIVKYQSSYKGHLIALNVRFVAESSILTHSYDCVVDSTDELVEVKDKRTVREPEINEGDVITVYGKITDIKNVKKKAENSGWLNSNLFAKTAEEFEVPVIEFVYTDIDNLGIIKSGDPNDKDVNEDLEFEEMLLELDRYIE